MALNSGKSYAGKIANKGSQKVQALFSSVLGKKGKVQEGGDLRARPSKNAKLKK